MMVIRCLFAKLRCMTATPDVTSGPDAAAPQPARLAHELQAQGYAVWPGFWSGADCERLRARAMALADSAPAGDPAVFSSTDRARSTDAALFASAEAVACFYEADALNAQGRLTRPPAESVNKIGHALHDLDPVFDAASRDPRLAALAAALGLRRPLLWQSQLIFKPPGIGGAVRWHQDASFFETTPQTVTTFWFALDDAGADNGALWVLPGGHRGPLRERFVRDGDRLRHEPLDPAPWPAEGEGLPLPVAAGSLVVFHGLLPHASGPNRSPRRRLAYVLHLTDGEAAYAPGNWLQRSARLPVRGF